MDNKDLRWWLSDKPHEGVVEEMYRIHTNTESRRSIILRSLRMYGNSDVSGYTPDSYYRTQDSERMTLNVIKSITDTITAMVSRSKPRPVFLSEGGNDSLRIRAKNLEKFVSGVLYKCGVDMRVPHVILDALVFDIGVMKIYRHPGTTKITIERTFPGEIHVDPLEGLYGEPQQLHQTKYINKDVLKSLYPGHDIEIDAVDNDRGWDTWEVLPNTIQDIAPDQILVVESWHKPSSPEAKDGKHVVTIADATLMSEDWDGPEFPFVFLRWSSRLLGFFGMGLAEELTGVQVEINRILMRIQDSFKRLAVPWVFVENGTRVNKAILNNQVGAIIPYTGTAPIVKPNQTVHPEVFAHLDRLVTQAYMIGGISQTFSGGEIPKGLTSGEAVREYNEVRNERYIVFVKAYENLFLDLAKHIVRLGKEISKEFPDWTMVAEKDKYTTVSVKWPDVDLDEDAFVLKVFPASALPPTPAGRFSKVQEMINTGMIDQKVGLRLLDFPDLESETNLDRAASDNIDRVIEKLLDEGEWEAPEPFQDATLALKKCQAAYNRAMEHGVPEDRLSLLREYMRATHLLLRRSAVAQQIPQEVMPGAGSPPAPGGQGVPMMSGGAPQGPAPGQPPVQ